MDPCVSSWISDKSKKSFCFFPDLTLFTKWSTTFWYLEETNPKRLQLKVQLKHKQSRDYLYLFFPENLLVACAHFNYPVEGLQQIQQKEKGLKVECCFVLSYLYFENRWICVAITYLNKQLVSKNGGSLQGISYHQLKCLGDEENDKERDLIISKIMLYLGDSFLTIPQLNLLESGTKSGTLFEVVTSNAKAILLKHPQIGANGMLVSCFAEQLETEWYNMFSSENFSKVQAQIKSSNTEISSSMKNLVESCLNKMLHPKLSNTSNLRFKKEVEQWKERNMKTSKFRISYKKASTLPTTTLMSDLDSFPVISITWTTSPMSTFLYLQREKRRDELLQALGEIDETSSKLHFPLDTFTKFFDEQYANAQTVIICGSIIPDLVAVPIRKASHSHQSHAFDEENVTDFAPKRIYISSLNQFFTDPDLLPLVFHLGAHSQLGQQITKFSSDSSTSGGGGGGTLSPGEI
jgi:hypothetical protein